jgi:hypothetical protein
MPSGRVASRVRGALSTNGNGAGGGGSGGGLLGMPLADMRAETMRALCRDFGAPHLSRTDEMKPFLEDVQTRGSEYLFLLSMLQEQGVQTLTNVS